MARRGHGSTGAHAMNAEPGVVSNNWIAGSTPITLQRDGSTDSRGCHQ